MSNSRIVAILSEKYPIIKVPESLYNPEIYPEKPERPLPPKEPKPYDFNSSNKKINNFVISAFVFFVFLLFQNAFMIFLGGIISVLTFLIRNDSVNQKQKKLEKKYKEDYKKYKEKLSVYKIELAQYNELKNRYNYKLNLMNQYNIDSVEQILKEEEHNYILSKALYPEYENINIIKGQSEDYFKEYLVEQFEKEIYTNMSLPCEPIYYPDFVLWNKERNLLIDIEIDEPYTAIDKKPIHCENPSRNDPDLPKDPDLDFLRQKNDIDRDRDFVLKFWIVMRFTKRQVIEAPKNCCFLIKEIRDTILNHGNLDSVDIEKVPREERWDIFDAKAMAQNNSRNNYLPMHLKIDDSVKNSKENTEDSSDSEDFLPF